MTTLHQKALLGADPLTREGEALELAFQTSILDEVEKDLLVEVVMDGENVNEVATNRNATTNQINHLVEGALGKLRHFMTVAPSLRVT